MYLFLLAIPLASEGLAKCVGFILTSFCEIKVCSVGLWGRSGVQGSRSEVTNIAFLGEIELGVQSWATVVPNNYGKDPVESLERTRKGFGSRWNALIAIGRRGRIPGCLAYGRRAKWIPVESAIRS